MGKISSMAKENKIRKQQTWHIVVNLGFRTYGLVIFINKKDNKRDKD